MVGTDWQQLDGWFYSNDRRIIIHKLAKMAKIQTHMYVCKIMPLYCFLSKVASNCTNKDVMVYCIYWGSWFLFVFFF